MTKSPYPFQPDYAVPPGWVLEERLEANGISQAELARRCGRSAKFISEVVAGKAPVEAKTALQFEKVLGVSANIWLGIEKRYRLHQTREAEAREAEASEDWVRGFPFAELAKRGAIRMVTQVSDKVEELLNFFGVASIEAWEKVSDDLIVRGGALSNSAVPSRSDLREFSDVLKASTLGLRESAHDYQASSRLGRHELAVVTWLRLVERKAGTQSVGDYNRTAFLEALKRIRHSTGTDIPVALKDARQLCNDVGVAFVWARPFHKPFISGAAWWLSPGRPVIALAGGERSDDQIWFSFFHEAAHILLHSKKRIFVDGDGQNESQDEADANKWAANFLIPNPDWQRFVNAGEIDIPNVEKFAMDQGISPGIVVGRLQREEHFQRANLNKLKASAELPDDTDDSIVAPF